MSLLSIKGLQISVNNTEIVHGLNLEIQKGEIHAIMGPNGSGKSTLVHALTGHPAYTITSGSVLFQGEDLLALAPHERAARGLFLAFQYPKEIAGVTLRSFLYAAYNAQIAVRNPDQKKISPIKFKKYLEEKAAELAMDPALIERAVNEGFSGGEKKKAEVLQMTVLRPLLAFLDETDSGLDIDALKTVAGGVNALKNEHFSALLVTHYARILEYITPDYIHVMVRGKIVESGGAELAKRLEKGGYINYSA